MYLEKPHIRNLKQFKQTIHFKSLKQTHIHTFITWNMYISIKRVHIYFMNRNVGKDRQEKGDQMVF